MTQPEIGRRFSIRRALHTREERRGIDAELLEDSLAVLALKQGLTESYPDAIVTITKPRGHPLARIRAKAIWGVEEGLTSATDGMNSVAIPIWNSNQVQLRLVRSWINSQNGIEIKSGEGRRILPNNLDPELVVSSVRAAIEKPSRAVHYSSPGSRKHEKVI